MIKLNRNLTRFQMAPIRSHMHPINKRIVDGVRRLIASGELPVGAALPSVRGLAQQLTINPNTVAKAYSELTDSLTLRYKRKAALDNLTLSVQRGGIHAIIGANGAGKSTLPLLTMVHAATHR